MCFQTSTEYSAAKHIINDSIMCDSESFLLSSLTLYFQVRWKKSLKIKL